ncbi:hypothetical protein P7K49_029568, partial [Saguinus oedipus]
ELLQDQYEKGKEPYPQLARTTEKNLPVPLQEDRILHSGQSKSDEGTSWGSLSEAKGMCSSPRDNQRRADLQSEALESLPHRLTSLFHLFSSCGFFIMVANHQSPDSVCYPHSWPPILIWLLLRHKVRFSPASDLREDDMESTVPYWMVV